MVVPLVSASVPLTRITRRRNGAARQFAGFPCRAAAERLCILLTEAI
jgi:hypothetical protein